MASLFCVKNTNMENTRKSEIEDNANLGHWSTSSIILSSFLSFILILFTYIYSKHKQLERDMSIKTNGIPIKDFKKVVPLVGDISMLLYPIEYQEDNHPKLGDIFGTMMLNEPHIVVTGPSLLDQIFYENAKQITQEWPSHFAELVGLNSILVVSREEHKKQTKIVISHVGIPVLSHLSRIFSNLDEKFLTLNFLKIFQSNQ